MYRRHRFPAAVSLALLAVVSNASAIDSATLARSSLSPDCLAYRIVGVCYWLRCTPYGCKVKTSVKVRHYVPDAVVSSDANTGANPWHEVALMSPTNQANENALLKFKNADVIGHTGTLVFNRFASQFGYSCTGAGTAYRPYLLSSFNFLAWRYNLPEEAYPEALTPGQREVGVAGDLWGSVYPRGGFLQQADDYKANAVVAQRAGDVVRPCKRP